MRRTELSANVFTIDGVLSPDECQAMIARAESKGFEIATITAWDGPRVDRATRSNDRVIVDDTDLAHDVWTRVSAHIPQVRSGRQVRGLNERFRFYRYTPGQRFYWHSDGPFARDNGELSLLTFMVYLSEDYGGGATRFESLTVAGRMGMALVFDHGLIHEGASVTEGVKYVLRSDVMYGPVGQFAG
jgi:prolyl 4-hydroxylase